MFAVESYAAVRRFVFAEGHSRREAARVFGLNREMECAPGGGQNQAAVLTPCRAC